MPNDKYMPRPEHKFSFGLWTVGNRGRDPFGEAVRPTLPPEDAVRLLAEAGAWGVNFHDNDLVPIDTTPAERDRIVRGFQAACEENALTVPMATVNLFFDPVFRDGAFTANDPHVRAYAVQKTLRAMDLGQNSGRRFSCCGAAEKGLRQTPAAALTKPSSDCVRPLITSVDIRWTIIMVTSSRLKRSRMNRGRTSICRRQVHTLP
jgi:xylose isomerase